MQRRRFLALLGSLSVLPPAMALAELSPASRVSGYGLSQAGGSSQLVLELLGGKTRFQTFSLNAPPRLVIDLDGVVPRLPGANPDFSGTPVRGLRAAAHGNGMRLVLDLDHALQPKVSLLPGATAQQQRLVIELPHLAGASLASAASKPAESATPAPEKLRRRAIVAIDAGHGGKDPGAVSATDRYEKDVVISIAHKVESLLAANPMLQPVLIRDDDHFVELAERVHIAHQRKADMFISVHADAAPNASAQGASVYVLSEHGATSTMARWMAQTENSADRYAGKDSSLYSPDPVLSKVLVDMSMTATISASLDLGRQLIRNIGQVTRIHQTQVDQAGFAVLKSPDIPSVLVETGFMSNLEDCRRLITDGHQQELADALQHTVGDYFRNNPLAYRGA